MIFSLDSNVVIDLLGGRRQVRARYDAARSNGAEFKICSLVLEELRFGAEISGHADLEHRTLDRMLADMTVEPFDAADARVAAAARGVRKRAGKPVGQVDALIGGQALARGWTMVTNNTRHFEALPGLVLENWAVPLPT